MNKKRRFLTIFAIVLLLVTSLALAACSNPDDGEDYNGNVTVTPEIAAEVLSNIEFGNKMYWTAGSSEYGYNINSDGYVVYEKNSDGDETYYGGSGADFYKVMITSEGRSYTRVTKWEAMLALEEAKADMTEFLDIMSNGFLDMMLEEQKEYGGDFGKLTVSGNIYKEKEEDALPQSGSILYSIKTVQYSAALIELEFLFTDKKLMSITNRFSSEVQGYVPDNIRQTENESETLSFEYGRTLSMPADKGTDETNPQDKVSVYRKGSTLPTLYNQTKGAIVPLGTPEDAGTFLGWYYDEYCQLPVEGDYKVGYEGSCTVYAKWQVPAIQTQLNGGVLAKGYQNSLLKCIYLKDINELIPSKKGYRFEGWYKDAAFENEVEYGDYTQITSSTTVYAKWVPIIKITLSADISYTLPKLMGVEGQKMRLEYFVPVKRGGIFAGWFKDSGFQTAVTEDEFPAANTTYYAKFDQAICIDINLENATLTPNGVDNYVNIPLTESEEYGFQDFFDEITGDYPGGGNAMGECFTGWYKDSALTQPLTREYPTADMTLYPKIAQKYYYTIDAGEGELSETSIYQSDEERAINSMIAKLLPVADILAEMASVENLTPPEGKIFAGWYSDAALTVAYNPTSYPTQNTTIYAKYEAIA